MLIVTALVLITAVSSRGQSITAEGDVYIDGSPALGPQAVPLDVPTIDVGSTNFSSSNNVPAQGRLVLDGGADLIVGELTAGNVEFNAFGLIEASGFGTSIDANHLSIGGSGDGQLILRDGAVAVANGFASFGSNGSANQPGSGDLELQGSGSTLQVFSNAEFNFGQGQVTDGGRLLIDGQANIGSDENSYDLNLATGGRFEATQFVYIGSSNFVTSAQSRVTIGEGGEFAADTAVIYNGGSIQLNGGRIRSNFISVASGNMTGYGEVGGSIRVLSGIDETTSGRLSITPGRELNIRRSFSQSTALYNNGRIENDGAITIDDGLFENDFDGSYLGRNSTLRGRLIENEGQIDLIEGFNQIDAELNNFTTGNTEAAPRVTVSGGATALFTGDVNNDGQIRVETGSTATFTQNVSGSGTFDGSGEVVFLGSFTPGNSPGLVSFGGDLVLGDSLVSEFEILGEQRGTEYDAVDVAGSLQLGGTLFATVSTAAAGDVFTLFDAQGGVTGVFDNVEFESPLPDSLTLDVIYTATQVQVAVLNAALLGDYNGNGEVDAADYTVWQDNFNSTTNLAADGNGDGRVDAADYTVWQDNFGNTLSAGSLTSIPEPTSLALVFVGGLALTSRRRNP